jgi:hypothetical protein
MTETDREGIVIVLSALMVMNIGAFIWGEQSTNFVITLGLGGFALWLAIPSKK